MKLNKKQKRILYISFLTILLMSLFSKKYILPNCINDIKCCEYINVNNIEQKNIN